MTRLTRIFYVSKAQIGSRLQTVSDILAVARTFNAEHEITGLLTYDGEHFTQVLEGPATVLDTLMARISADPRHGRVRVLARKPIISRDFEDWSMGYLHDGRFNDAVAGLLAESHSDADEVEAFIGELIHNKRFIK